MQKMRFSHRLIAYGHLMRWPKPIGILLLGWPMLWALWLSNKGWPGCKLLTIFVVGCVVMRSAGCVINDITDCRVDAYVARTRNRPLVTGAITNRQAWMLWGILCSLGAFLLIFLNFLSFIIACFALGFIVLYPWTKRFLHCPQLILGFAFASAILVAYAASQQTLSRQAWYVFAIAVLWTLIYDTQYAMADRDEDYSTGILSMAIWLGRHDRMFLIIVQMLMWTLLAGLSFFYTFNFVFWISMIGVGGLFLYQQTLTWHRKSASCFKAFMNNHWVGCVVFLGIALGLTPLSNL